MMIIFFVMCAIFTAAFIISYLVGRSHAKISNENANKFQQSVKDAEKRIERSKLGLTIHTFTSAGSDEELTPMYTNFVAKCLETKGSKDSPPFPAEYTIVFLPDIESNDGYFLTGDRTDENGTTNIEKGYATLSGDAYWIEKYEKAGFRGDITVRDNQILSVGKFNYNCIQEEAEDMKKEEFFRISFEGGEWKTKNREGTYI